MMIERSDRAVAQRLASDVMLATVTRGRRPTHRREAAERFRTHGDRERRIEDRDDSEEELCNDREPYFSVLRITEALGDHRSNR